MALQAYHEIEARLVTETVFSQYMYKTLPTSNHLWAFKKQFCVQMALSGAHACLCCMALPHGHAWDNDCILALLAQSAADVIDAVGGAGLMSHMLLIGGRTPYKILFARSSGKTFQACPLIPFHGKAQIPSGMPPCMPAQIYSRP